MTPFAGLDESEKLRPNDSNCARTFSYCASWALRT